ncbi:hypothetical protein SAMN05216556_10911 [Aequorivita viscosa]|nr:hypothetical protein SAMN05216556_10911 [Aequorivita viscosa]
MIKAKLSLKYLAEFCFFLFIDNKGIISYKVLNSKLIA